MEQCEEHDIYNTTNVTKTNISPKSKQKKKSLCRMLLNKKTKVGCLETSYKDNDSNKNSKMENSQYGSHTSTKLSLCCAMTERSRTPPQSLTVSRLSPTTLSRTSVKSEVASVNGNSQMDIMIEKEEMYVASGTQDIREHVAETSSISAGKDQRQSVFVKEMATAIK
nr:PREDICTED: uncharacterized protein LOC100880474 isoform X1 [Megachile rotundata]